MRVALLLLVAAVCALPGQAQVGETGTVKEVMAGRFGPVTLKVKDLDGTWTALSVTLAESAKPAGADPAQPLTAMFGGEERPVTYYTQRRIVTAEGLRYLIAYRPYSKPLDAANLSNFEKIGQADPTKIIDMLAPPVTPDTPLGISLLDLRDIRRLELVRPFESKEAVSERLWPSGNTAVLSAILFPVFAQARAKAREASSVSNLRQLGLAAMLYAQDYDEHLPPLENMQVAKKLLYPYVKNDEIFKQPGTGEPYRTNPAASRKSLAAIVEPTKLILFYEATPGATGHRAVVFADGHAKAVSEAEWPDVQADSAAAFTATLVPPLPPPTKPNPRKRR
jgi:hypothetical protein